MPSRPPLRVGHASAVVDLVSPSSMPRTLVPASRREGRQDWLASVLAAAHELAARWGLELGEPFQPGGRTARVVPARRGREELVLKVMWSHPGAEREPEALRLWDGAGAVRLLETTDLEPDTIAMLLERCLPGEALSELAGEPDQDEVVAG